MPARNSKPCSKMNTNPDETKLALWLEDELHGTELAEFEEWLAGNPEHLAAREEVRRWRALIAAIPATEEPPYPDFFNSRVMRTIRESSVPVAQPQKPRFSWRTFLMPAAACAGMVLAFLAGSRTRPAKVEFDVAGAPKAIPVDPILYTPEKGVKAEWFTSSDASATVIVLNGVDAIPDATDFSKTVMLESYREIDSTAWLDGESTSGEGL
jgi:hypothetical protein